MAEPETETSAPPPRWLQQAKVFSLIRLLEFFFAWALLFLFRLGQNAGSPYDYWRDDIRESFILAGVYEILLLYLPLTCIVWLTLLLVRKDRWIPVSVPVVYVLHCAVLTGALFHGEEFRLWCTAMLGMAIIDYLLGRLARPERLYKP